MSQSIKGETPKRNILQSGRSYLSKHYGLHQMSPHNHSGSSGPMIQQQDSGSIQSQMTGLIYGTNISIKQVEQKLQRFIKQFEVFKHEQEVPQKIYQTKLNEIDILQKHIFDVQAVHLRQFDRQLYYQLIYFPAQMISFFDDVIKALYQKRFITNSTLDENDLKMKIDKKERLMVGIKKMSQITFMRNLSPKHINRLICFRGIVVRSSDIFPQMKRAYFKCNNPICEGFEIIILENAKVQQPKFCKFCSTNNSFQIVHNLCEFTDKQFIKFQELPEYVPEGETPNSITIICYDDNVDGMKPGDRVQIIGIYRAQASKIQVNRKTLKSIFGTYVDLISYNIIQDNRYMGVYGTQLTKVQDRDKEKFIQMADRKTIIEDLVKSFAPSVYGNDNIKKGILAQLFGGTKKDFKSSGRPNFRPDINICLVGDPSTAKSQLLQQVYKIAPRGIYTSGRGSSAVGLTANVRKDPQTRQFVLESGALVLSDLGICCIDQFDKMQEDSKTILLQAMEQQTISIAKAGIVCSLNSRTAIISAANPVNSKYNPQKSVVENINLPPALLSRFDLIYIMLDKPNQTQDRLLASHLLGMYTPNNSQIVENDLFPRDILSKYITYSREYISPKLSKQAGVKLVDAYVEMRKLGNSRKVITATPRQLQSLIRISQAFAKMRLSKQVSQKDVQEALNLIKVATQQAATDPNTGIIDMDVLVTGRTAAYRSKVTQITLKLKELMLANKSKYMAKTSFDVIMKQISPFYELQFNEPIGQKQLLQAMHILQNQDIIAVFGGDKNRPFCKLSKG